MAKSRKSARSTGQLDGTEVRGHGKTLEVAMDDFAARAIEAGIDAGAIVPIRISVELHNPHVSDYIVEPG